MRVCASSAGDQPAVHEHDASYADRQASSDDFTVAAAKAIKWEVRYRRHVLSQHLASLYSYTLLLSLFVKPHYGAVMPTTAD